MLVLIVHSIYGTKKQEQSVAVLFYRHCMRKIPLKSSRIPVAVHDLIIMIIGVSTCSPVRKDCHRRYRYLFDFNLQNSNSSSMIELSLEENNRILKIYQNWSNALKLRCNGERNDMDIANYYHHHHTVAVRNSFKSIVWVITDTT
jgi:hypothetical protein